MADGRDMSLPTQAQLLELFAYDPETGALTGKTWRGPKAPGSAAGYLHPSGYILVQVEGAYTSAHRIIWCMVKGYWPVEVDHRNLIGADNRWDNLREATHAQNCMNRRLRADNIAGFKGVQKDGNTYRARITINGKLKNLGRFETAEAAAAAYRLAAAELHGEFYSGSC
jgi:hypothetical protein